MDLLAVLVVAVYSASAPASAMVINRVIQNPGNADLLKLIGAGGGLGPGGLGGLGGLLGGAGGLGGAGAVQEPVDFEGDFTANMKKFQRQVLRYTNRLRRLHGVHTLKQDPVLDRYAQAWALTLAERDTMQHRTSPLYGENLYMFWSSDLKAPIKGSMVVKSWYDEIKQYDFNHPGFRHGIGHFTQLVWKDSRRLGTGIARGRKGTLYVVCVYDPRGNIMTQFAQQVPRPLPTPSSDRGHAQGRR